MTRKRLVEDGLLDYGFQFVPQKEQEFIAEYASQRFGIQYEFTRQEYRRLRELARKARLDPEEIEEFDRDYCFTHIMARKLRTGAHNAMTGICYDVAVRNYARIGDAIQGQWDRRGSKRFLHL